MPALNLDVNYFSHIKIIRLVAQLGRGSELLPIKIWCHCGVHHADTGIMAGYSKKEIESLAGWAGEEGEMIKAMESIGLLEKIENGWKVHDWESINGHLVTFHERAKNAAKARWSKYATSNAPSIVKQCPKPNLTIPNLTKSIIPPTPLPKGDSFDTDSKFAEIWELYPRKEGSKIALKHFRATVRTDADFDRIKGALKNYLYLLRTDNTPAKYIKMGSTWFNNWQDYAERKTVSVSLGKIPPPENVQQKIVECEKKLQELVKNG